MALRPDRLLVVIELLFILKQILRNIRSRIVRSRRSEDTFLLDTSEIYLRF